LFLQVTNPSVPKISELKNWQKITWEVVLIFVPLGALNNADSGFFVWFIGLGSFIYFCSINMCETVCMRTFVLSFYVVHVSPQFVDNYATLSNPAPEYSVVFIINIAVLFFFSIVFAYELFCALRRRVVAFTQGESEAMKLYPRWFSTYRQDTLWRICVA
jgi:hypothetical protein